jgi:hypothetical protein
MARLRDIQKKVSLDQSTKAAAGLFLALENADSFCLSKTDEKGIELRVYKSMFSETFTAQDLFGLLQPFGNWLCRLPKGVWEIKNKNNNHETLCAYSNGNRKCTGGT